MKVEISRTLPYRAELFKALRIAEKHLDLSGVAHLRVRRAGPKHKHTARGLALWKPKHRAAHIEINRTNDRLEMFSTMLHELVHISQYSTGKLVDIEKRGIWSRSVWRGWLPILSLLHGILYKYLPWEREAHSFERRIMVEHHGFTLEEYWEKEITELFNKLEKGEKIKGPMADKITAAIRKNTKAGA